MARRILFLIAVLVYPVALFAQNDIGVWVNSNQYKSTTESDPTLPDSTFKFSVDRRVGFGVSLNHFSGPNVSTELAVHQLRGEGTAEVTSTNPTLRAQIDAGSFRVNVVSAVMKWHFMPQGFVTPYVGAGAAYFTGGKFDVNAQSVGDTAQRVKFQNKFNYVVDGGVNFNVMRNVAIGADVRYSPYKANDKNDPTSGSLKLNPLTIGLGVRFRM